MIRRVLGLAALVVLGGAPGLFDGSAAWTLLGALLGAAIWAVLDSVRAARVLGWLQNGDLLRPPKLSGMWEELADRARKGFKRYRRKAQLSDARLNEFLAAIQASPNGVVLLDRRDAIEWCNLTAAQHLGFDPQRDLQQQIGNLVRDPGFVAYLNRQQFGAEIEVVGRQSTGQTQQRIALQIHPYAKGRKLLITRDVTALQLAEAMRRDFVANVSHEIRTPLTVLSGFVETMQNLELDESDKQRYLSLMASQAARMRTLVSDLLMLSRLEGSPLPGTSEWSASQDLLDQVVHEGRALSEVVAKGGHVINAAPSPRFRLAGSRGEWLSAMSNLVGNAVRYTPAGGRIDAGWKQRDDGGIQFYVKDTGPGVAPEHLPRLTERFYRVDRSRSRETGGTGLGLAIVKHVAQRHGGQMQVESTLGKGSCFCITVPAMRVQMESPAPDDAAGALTEHPDAPKSPLRDPQQH